MPRSRKAEERLSNLPPELISAEAEEATGGRTPLSDVGPSPPIVRLDPAIGVRKKQGPPNPGA